MCVYFYIFNNVFVFAIVGTPASLAIDKKGRYTHLTERGGTKIENQLSSFHPLTSTHLHARGEKEKYSIPNEDMTGFSKPKF